MTHPKKFAVATYLIPPRPHLNLPNHSRDIPQKHRPSPTKSTIHGHYVNFWKGISTLQVRISGPVFFLHISTYSNLKSYQQKFFAPGSGSRDIKSHGVVSAQRKSHGAKVGFFLNSPQKVVGPFHNFQERPGLRPGQGLFLKSKLGFFLYYYN